jgi:hypothetical protein
MAGLLRCHAWHSSVVLLRRRAWHDQKG